MADHQKGISPSTTFPTVLLTNDDGPPPSVSGSSNGNEQPESPFIHSFAQHLVHHFLGQHHAKLKVVIPDSQKSWIGKAYLIKDKISISRFDPLTNQVMVKSEVKASKKDQLWYLVNGTPATCSNIGLFNLFPGLIDLVISGPNFGRNTSSAFSLSSGTVGAAMDAALSNHKAIALSYGIFDQPISESILQAANAIAIKIIRQLWLHGFGGSSRQTKADEAPDLYSINIPLVPGILSDPRVVWTHESHTKYARLFSPIVDPSTAKPTQPAQIDELSSHLSPPPTAPTDELNFSTTPVEGTDLFDYMFEPDITSLIDPNTLHHSIGSDAWALNQGYCTVTPLKAAFKNVRPPAEMVPFQQPDSNGVHFWNL